MCPQTCWNEIKGLLAERGTNLLNQEERQTLADMLADRLEDLAEWIRGGGFWPQP